MLVVARTELGHGLNDLEAAEIRRVAHGRSPIAAPHRQVQHFGIRSQDLEDGVAIAAFDHVLKRTGAVATLMRFFMAAQFAKPYSQAITRCAFAQLKRRNWGGDIGCIIELGMPMPNSFQCLGTSFAPVSEQFARFTLWNVKMGSLWQPTGDCGHKPFLP